MPTLPKTASYAASSVAKAGSSVAPGVAVLPITPWAAHPTAVAVPSTPTDARPTFLPAHAVHTAPMAKFYNCGRCLGNVVDLSVYHHSDILLQMHYPGKYDS